MDLASFVVGILSSLAATAIWVVGTKKRRGYTERQIKELEFEKSRIEAFAARPTELYRDSLAGMFYLFFIVALANCARLFHGLLYDSGVVWQQVFIEVGLWCLVGFLAIRYKKRIDAVYNLAESVAALDERIQALKQKA